MLIILTVSSCGTSLPTNEKEIKTVTVTDTVYIEVPYLNEKRISELESDVKYWKNIVDSCNNTIPYSDYMNARRIEKIKYYISICEKNTNNKKFFFGWIKRTMSEN